MALAIYRREEGSAKASKQQRVKKREKTTNLNSKMSEATDADDTDFCKG
jgi:hypothetical protein